MRRCVQKHKILGEHVLEVAKVITIGLCDMDNAVSQYCSSDIFPSMVVFMVDTCKSCRRGWMICYMLASLRTTESLQLCLQM